ncbi:unnamed protein product [Boreogadus saida]
MCASSGLVETRKYPWLAVHGQDKQRACERPPNTRSRLSYRQRSPQCLSVCPVNQVIVIGTSTSKCHSLDWAVRHTLSLLSEDSVQLNSCYTSQSSSSLLIVMVMAWHETGAQVSGIQEAREAH